MAEDQAFSSEKSKALRDKILADIGKEVPQVALLLDKGAAHAEATNLSLDYAIAQYLLEQRGLAAVGLPAESIFKINGLSRVSAGYQDLPARVHNEAADSRSKLTEIIKKNIKETFGDKIKREVTAVTLEIKGFKEIEVGPLIRSVSEELKNKIPLVADQIQVPPQGQKYAMENYETQIALGNAVVTMLLCRDGALSLEHETYALNAFFRASGLTLADKSELEKQQIREARKLAASIMHAYVDKSFNPKQMRMPDGAVSRIAGSRSGSSQVVGG